MPKAKEKYSNERAAEYYKQNKEAIKEKSREHYRNLSQEEKTRLKSIKEKNIKNWFNIKKKHYKISFFFLNIKMSEKNII